MGFFWLKKCPKSPSLVWQRINKWEKKQRCLLPFKLRNWVPFECLCRICKTYIQQVGFLKGSMITCVHCYCYCYYHFYDLRHWCYIFAVLIWIHVSMGICVHANIYAYIYIYIYIYVYISIYIYVYIYICVCIYIFCG